MYSYIGWTWCLDSEICNYLDTETTEKGIAFCQLGSKIIVKFDVGVKINADNCCKFFNNIFLVTNIKSQPIKYVTDRCFSYANIFEDIKSRECQSNSPVIKPIENLCSMIKRRTLTPSMRQLKFHGGIMTKKDVENLNPYKAYRGQNR